MQIFGSLEGNEIGLTYSNATMEIYNYTFVRGLYMMIISFIFFTVLGLYLDKVLPKTYGETRGVCFCFSKRFCCSCCKKSSVDDSDEDADTFGQDQKLIDTGKGDELEPFECKYLNASEYEPVPSEVARLEQVNKCLRIENLKKVYPDGSEAVNGINLKMYSGQIFALLGQNGAGKSTMVSMLTGLLKKTSGSAQIFGKDLFNEMDDVRTKMGVCPQHDVLFDNLTPEEHLSIFYDFKGGDPSRKKEELSGLIAEMGVSNDRRKVAKSLSGGNRRKLSVAIALCGESKFVILDEPTAGMDLGARRALQDMLINYK